VSPRHTNPPIDSSASQDSFFRELPLHTPRLWRFCLRLTRHTADAEDLLQRTHLRALERRHQFQPQTPNTSLISWLFAICHSIWLNELRSAQRRRTESLDAPEPWSTDDSPSAAERIPDTHAPNDPEYALLCRQIANAVRALPDAQRSVMLMVAVEGLSYREAADALDVPIGTVMSRLARARLLIGQRFLGQPHLTHCASGRASGLST
jgi:RNA polymerase sigma-70 factor, ECF subfamily